MTVYHQRCPLCHAEVTPLQVKIACDRCMAWHHESCWVELGGQACGACRSVLHLSAPVTAPAAGAGHRDHKPQKEVGRACLSLAVAGLGGAVCLGVVAGGTANDYAGGLVLMAVVCALALGVHVGLVVLSRH